MTRRMSVSLTLGAVRARTKTVTRRHIDTWRDLAAGDRLTLIEKGMGLPKGAKQVVVAEVEIVDVRAELLGNIHAEDRGTVAEGLGHLSCSEFVRFWADSHGHAGHEHPADLTCRRIEWRYLDDPSATPPAAPLGEEPVEDRVGGQVQDEVFDEVAHHPFRLEMEEVQQGGPP